MSDPHSTLHRLMALVVDRKTTRPPGSYTTALMEGGVEKIGAKLLEEAAEVAQAAAEPGAEGQTHLVREAADLLYHLLVMLGFRDVHLEAVEAELVRREGTSGLEEKASRTKPPPAP